MNALIFCIIKSTIRIKILCIYVYASFFNKISVHYDLYSLFTSFYLPNLVSVSMLQSKVFYSE